MKQCNNNNKIMMNREPVTSRSTYASLHVHVHTRFLPDAQLHASTKHKISIDLSVCPEWFYFSLDVLFSTVISSLANYIYLERNTIFYWVHYGQWPFIVFFSLFFFRIAHRYRGRRNEWNSLRFLFFFCLAKLLLRR